MTNLRDLAKTQNVFIYLYTKSSEKKNDFFNNYVSNNEDSNTFIVSYNCAGNASIMTSLRSEIPFITKIFPVSRFDFALRQKIKETSDINEFLESSMRQQTNDIFGNFQTQLDLPNQGGTAFHLRANKNSKILELYNEISKLYFFDLYHIHFSYSINKKSLNPTLTVYYSKSCVRVFKVTENTLAKTIYSNRYSHYHYFEKDEFLSIVNHSSAIAFLIPRDSLTDDDIDKISIASQLTCGKMITGWTNKRATGLGQALRANSNTSEEIAIVNRNTDCLFHISLGHTESNLIYYINDALVNTHCWRYPENSTKVVEVHYRKAAILCCLITTLSFAYLIYSTAKSV